MEQQLQHMEVSSPARGATAATRGESIRSQHIQDGRLRRPYLTEDDFRVGGADRGESTHTRGLSESESRRRSILRIRHADLRIPPEMTAEEVRARNEEGPREELDGWAPPMPVSDGWQRRASEWVDGEHTDPRTWEQETISPTDTPAEHHPSTQTPTDDSGWGDLEDALSTHIARRHARHLEYVTQNAQLDAENQHLARRREDRISALVDGGQSFRLRHRASRERILAAMEGFMVERDRDRDRDREQQMSRTGDELGGGQSAQPQRSEQPRRLTVANTGSHTASNTVPAPNIKTQNTLTYLSRLRFISPEEATELARPLNITPSLTSLSSLPKPVFSSLLTPGATFAGTQIAGSKPSAVGRDRDYLRRMVASRNRLRGSVAGQGAQQPGVTPMQVQGVSAARAAAERVMAREEGRGADLGPPGELGTQGGEERSGGERVAEPPRQVRETKVKPPRQWDVSVTMHAVDLVKGTVEGMMIAERVRSKGRTSATAEAREQTPEEKEAEKKKKESCMRSFFDGEIIDLREVTLETEGYKKEGVKVDLGVDARYWRGVGPFREALKEEEEEGGKADEGDKEREADERLARLLGNEAWMQKMMTEWILMRWRERCVLPSVAAPSLSNNGSNNSTELPAASSSTATASTTNTNPPPTSNSSSDAPSSTNTWNLTIGGFYYIALKRDTGRIDGLYYDPQSEPLQRLDLGGGGGGGGIRRWFPSVGFE